jgi:predicted GNAT family acetyltransferase
MPTLRKTHSPSGNAFQPLPTTPNRAIDESKRNILADSSPWSAHHWSGARKNNWYLALCAVDPSYEGQGFGRELVAWGLGWAREENVHASVIASKGNEKFYLRCGFDEVVGNCTEGEGNPLNGVGGGDILFMYPKVNGVDA